VSIKNCVVRRNKNWNEVRAYTVESSSEATRSGCDKVSSETLSLDAAADGSVTCINVEWLATTLDKAELDRERCSPGAWLETDNGTACPNDGRLESDRVSKRSEAIAKASSRMRTRSGRVMRRWPEAAATTGVRDAHRRAPRLRSRSVRQTVGSKRKTGLGHVDEVWVESGCNRGVKK
jgi:hypothetical protein